MAVSSWLSSSRAATAVSYTHLEQIYIERLYGFDEAGKIQLIRKNGQLLSEEYKAEGIEVKAYVPKEIYAKV